MTAFYDNYMLPFLLKSYWVLCVLFAERTDNLNCTKVSYFWRLGGVRLRFLFQIFNIIYPNNGNFRQTDCKTRQKKARSRPARRKFSVTEKGAVAVSCCRGYRTPAVSRDPPLNSKDIASSAAVRISSSEGNAAVMRENCTIRSPAEKESDSREISKSDWGVGVGETFANCYREGGLEGKGGRDGER